MAVMHTVFEGAAFAYMSLLAKFEFENERMQSIQGIAKIIMIDEARHMAEGFHALDHMKKTMVTESFAQGTKAYVERNAIALRELPAQTITENNDFTSNLYQLYDDNVSKNMRRVYR